MSVGALQTLHTVYFNLCFAKIFLLINIFKFEILSVNEIRLLCHQPLFCLLRMRERGKRGERETGREREREREGGRAGRFQGGRKLKFVVM